MRIPTIDQFNAWKLKDKSWWIHYETGGQLYALCLPGHLPMIFYPAEKTAIVYKVENGVIEEAVMMTEEELLLKYPTIRANVKKVVEAERIRRVKMN